MVRWCNFCVGVQMLDDLTFIVICSTLSSLLTRNNQRPFIKDRSGRLAPLRWRTLRLLLAVVVALWLLLAVSSLEVVALPPGVKGGPVPPNGGTLVRRLVGSHGTGAVALGLAVATEHAEGQEPI